MIYSQIVFAFLLDSIVWQKVPALLSIMGGGIVLGGLALGAIESKEMQKELESSALGNIDMSDSGFWWPRQARDSSSEVYPFLDFDGDGMGL